MFKYGNLQNSNILSPEASIKLSNPSVSSQSCEVKAIVDTGATRTCIPESAIEDLGRSLVYSHIKVRDANGGIRTVKTYLIDISIGDEQHSNIEVIAIPKEYGLIGRDILNQHKVILNARKNQWSFDDSKLDEQYPTQNY